MSSQPDDYIITTGTIDAEGNQTFKTRTPVTNPDKRTDKQKRKDQRQAFMEKLKVYGEFLDQHSDIAALITAAMADFKNGVTWTDQKFQSEYSKTEFAKSLTKSQEEFDLGMGGANADTYIKKVDDAKKSLLQSSARMGVPMTDAEAQTQATEIVRSGLSQAAVDAIWAKQYEGLTTDSEASKIAGEPVMGTAGQIQQSLQDTARSYGLKISDELLRSKTGEALGQGERWQEYLQGQKDYFRQQAKLMYPNAAALFDSQNLTQISEGYLQEASSILGTASAEMDITDPKWTAFLNGADGKILSKDEWTRVLRTDSKYGYDKSLNARKEYSNLTDELFTAFGMA